MKLNNIYQKLGLKAIINASGRMTKLGVSTISDDVGSVLVEAAQNYVDVDELMILSGKKIASLIGCEDSCVTSSASAGISLSVASLICKNNVTKIERFYETLQTEKKRQVILLRGHNINYSVPISLMIELGGGQVVEAGYANSSEISDISGVVNENTLAIMFVHSHYCVQKNMVAVKEVVEYANQANIPIIIDGGAEEDLSAFMEMGADFVCFSGSKAIGGPTSGFVACKTTEFAENMRLQYKGIGRAMKIGKENIMGLVKAIEMYQTNPVHPSIVTIHELEDFKEKVNQIDGLSCLLMQDEVGRKIYRAKIRFDEKVYGMNAKQVSKMLISQNPAIYTRDHEANVGVLSIDPRPLNSKLELVEIYNRLKSLGK